MTWTEARSGAATTTRRVAHDDRAKDRRDETSRSSGPRPRPRWLVPLVVAAALVLLGGAGAVALVTSGDEPSPDRSAGSAGSPSPGGATSGAPASGEPLSGDLTAVGSVTSTSSLGTRWAFPMTVRLDCPDSCRVTVTEVPGEYAAPARSYVERTFSPGSGGVYGLRFDIPLTEGGGFVKQGCEALRVRGEGSLVRAGDVVTLTVSHPKDQFDGSNGPCLLVDREFVFTGTLS